MTRAVDMHFAENIGRIGKFVFGFELDAGLALRLRRAPTITNSAPG